jgi:PAS domain S-box-containing protein
LVTKDRVHRLFQRTAFRYGFGVAAIAVALTLQILFTPLTGKAGPFVLFFGATLATSLYAGPGPAFLSLVLSLPVAGYLFVVHDGYPVSEAAFQALSYGIGGLIAIHLTASVRNGRRTIEDASLQLRRADEARARSVERARETIELAPDAYFLADLDARLTEVNQAACRLLGYERDELVGTTILGIISLEDAARFETVRTELLMQGTVSRAEWTLKRKNGTLVPVEISSNILPDGRWQAFARDLTERRRTEDQRQICASILDNCSDFIGIADPTGKPIYVNPAGRRMVGLSAEYPVPQTRISDYYARELGSFPTDVILKTMTERGYWSGETFFRHFQTNAPIRVSDAHFLIRDASGQRLLGMGTITRDISEARRSADEHEQLLRREQLARRQVESANAQLRESEERFRLTIDEAAIGMALVALDGRFVRVNRALCELTGYSSDELTRMTFQDITHPEDLDTDVMLARQLARGEIPRCRFDKRYIRKDGSIVDVVLNASVLRRPAGAPQYFISQIEDVTERKRAEAALRLSEAKFSAIISVAADAIISVDADQRITIFNEGAEHIFGYSKSEMLGAPLETLIPERFRAAHRAHFEQFAAGPDTARHVSTRREVFGLRKNGEEFPAEASISKVVLGGLTVCSVVLRDVTYRKSVEEALQRALAARDDVLGIVAHDLRNPLSAIILQTMVMERSGPDPERRSQTARQIISRSADRMNRLIQDLVEVAVVESGQLKVERERISVADLIRDAVASQALLASSSGLDVSQEVSADVHDVWGDRNRLLQVFENLIGNAIKFTQSGGHITVGAAPKEHEVLFSVADTGAGIAPQSVPYVFERFWQAAKEAGRVSAGLGLPIARGIIETLGGRIWVESTVGRGSTFFFTIPAAPTENDRPFEATPKNAESEISRD